MTARAYHIPKGDPCGRCGLKADRHLVDHHPQGDPCIKCGLGVAKHYRKKHKTHSQRAYYAGIDGEGQDAAGDAGRNDHRYVMLAWSNERQNQRGVLEAPPDGRLTTVQCLDFILSIPPAAKLFAFAFNYDLTKILTDLPDDALFKLFRPELRQRPPGHEKYGPRPVIWNGYSLNLMASKFTVKQGGRMRVIWDVFKFFQAAFVKALADWKVGEEEVLERMRLMKKERHRFRELTREQIRAYCFDECAYMAQLARKLTEAHEAAGLHLRNYFGAGSTASAVLKSMRIDEEPRGTPAEMQEAVSSAFFGGRFENRIVGEIQGTVYGADISAAYPFQLVFMPCLRPECGRWEKVSKRKGLEGARAAVVNYRLETPPKNLAWGPFPFRMQDGSICFPSTSGGGWVWLDEYLEGERLFPHVRFLQAFVYRCDCGHQPFAKVPKYYLERVRIGKEGPGIVLKLGTNAIYGKVAQSIGITPPFQCWIWAGMITSGTRAQMLNLLSMHQDPANLLMIATDGAYTRERIITPPPRDTGTGPDVARNEKGESVNKPLGGWEWKKVEGGMFAARPGIYFPLQPSDKDLDVFRARGVGRNTMIDNRQRVIDAWKSGAASVRLPSVSRFWGAKSSIGRVPIKDLPGQYSYVRHVNEKTGVPYYGQWTERPVEMSFNPLPKREEINPDGTLKIRAFAPHMRSLPYDRVVKSGIISPDTLALKRAQMEVMEQPDGADFADFVPEDGET